MRYTHRREKNRQKMKVDSFCLGRGGMIEEEQGGNRIKKKIKKNLRRGKIHPVI